VNKTIQQIVQSVPEDTAGLNVLSELQELVPANLSVDLPSGADPQTEVAAAVQAIVTLACGETDQSRILLEQMREVAARHPQHPIGQILDRAAPSGSSGNIAQSLDSGTFPAVPMPGAPDDTAEGNAIDKTIDSGSFPPVDPDAEDTSSTDGTRQTLESGTFPPGQGNDQTIDSDSFAGSDPGQTLDSGTFPPTGEPNQTIDSDSFAGSDPGQTLDSGTFPPTGDPNQTIDSDSFDAGDRRGK